MVHAKEKHLVIGSNSFLGRKLCEDLLHQNVLVSGAFNQNTNLLLPNIPQIQMGQLFDLDDTFDVVYIVSAFVPENNNETPVILERLQKVNINLVQEICSHFKTAKIVFCSTVSVYNLSSETITEATVPVPITAYGKSKLEAETIVAKHKSYAIVRISSMYGAYMKTNTFLPAIINSALKTNKITLFGQGNRLQNYISVKEVSNYLCSAALLKKNGIFLAVSKQSLSNTDVALVVKKSLSSLEIIYKGEDHSPSFNYNNLETRKQLTNSDDYGFNNELNALIAWMKKES